VDTTFDPKNNAANLLKHGVPLSQGDGVLNDPFALTIEDPRRSGSSGSSRSG
jgi:uncharacterized DUF497 family protein